jgi:hypothetical protein
MTGKINNVINEIPLASRQRIEEILLELENILSDIECNLPTEEDTDEAYVCQNIPKAKGIIESIRTLNSQVPEEDVESTADMVKSLSAELNAVFCQI